MLTDEARGQLFLETLERSNAFVIGLGSDRQWYRYHPLLREMLHHQLTIDEPQILPDLHRRAAQWFAASGYPIEALRHAAEAADWQLLGHLFVTQAAPLLVSAERTALDAELARIPAQLVFDGPSWRPAPQRGCCTWAGSRRCDRISSVPRRSCSERAWSRGPARTSRYGCSRRPSRTNGDLGGLIAAASEAIDELSGPGLALPAVDQYRAVALSNLGTWLLWTGDLEQAEERLLEGLEVTTATGLEVSRINALAHLALVAAVSGGCVRRSCTDPKRSSLSRPAAGPGWPRRRPPTWRSRWSTCSGTTSTRRRTCWATVRRPRAWTSHRGTRSA